MKWVLPIYGEVAHVLALPDPRPQTRLMKWVLPIYGEVAHVLARPDPRPQTRLMKWVLPIYGEVALPYEVGKYRRLRRGWGSAGGADPIRPL
jgi:hypothetical protein